MTKDEVIKLANDMAFMACIWIDDESNEINDLVKFAKLVAAAEREACAKECEHTAVRMGSEWMAHHCAEAIRARGKHETE